MVVRNEQCQQRIIVPNRQWKFWIFIIFFQFTPFLNPFYERISSNQMDDYRLKTGVKGNSLLLPQ